MHEYSLVRDIVQCLLDKIKSSGVSPDERIQEVILTIGELEIHSRESFRQAFKVLVKGTVLEKSVLRLETFPPTIECQKCGRKASREQRHSDLHEEAPFAECSSCGELAVLTGGRGVRALEFTFSVIV